MNYRFHPACLLFPKLGKEELQELADNIHAHGLLEDVVMYQGKVLDGRNRLSACKMARVKPRFIEWQGKGSPVEWVISENLIRRHLTSSQRAVIAHDLLPLLEKEAKERQRLSKGRGKKVANDLAILNGKASKMAARITKTNSAYVEAIKKVNATAPDLMKKLRDGVVNIPEAKKLAKLTLKERNRVLELCNGEAVTAELLQETIKKVKYEVRQKAAKSFARKNSGKRNILHGDMGLLWDRLDDNSVDLFLTDPPYMDAVLYERLSELAAAKLKPGGLCLAYCGQMYLPNALNALAKHLKYWWTIAIQLAAYDVQIHSRRVRNRWRLVLAFTKPPMKNPPRWLSDLLQGSGRDKQHHEWGQNESEASYLIDTLTEPGQLVVDPFCGGGAIPAACKAIGRRWLSTELDKATALIARKRLAEM